jgi:hypothetical protein
MLLISLILLVVGFFFPPAWLGLAAIGIYWYASRKSRRSEAVEERVGRMVRARQSHATFPDLYFEAARAYAIEKGGGTGGEQDSASVTMLVERMPYFVVFIRDLPGGGTMISVTSHDRIRDDMERFAARPPERSVEGTPNYKEIFSSAADAHRYIYADRSKTKEILRDKGFNDAWRESDNYETVASVVQAEALKGDVPSLKRMIEFVHGMYKDMGARAEAIKENRELALKNTDNKVIALKTLIGYCEVTVKFGAKEESHMAMAACMALFFVLTQELTTTMLNSPQRAADEARDAINKAIEHAHLFLGSGSNNAEWVKDASEILERFGPLAEELNAHAKSAG